jgi:5-hydroxyisourate hydrolase
MSAITTHVLDTSAGKPAAGLPVVLEFQMSGEWHEIGRGSTDSDGRLRTLVPVDNELQPGTYRISFDTSAKSAFYPRVAVEFIVHDPAQHYHVPLLLSPFGYSTYRGS